MIITSKAICAEGHARHLLNFANNRSIEVLRQHGRDDDGGVEMTIDNMAAISRSNPRCKRELFSVAISPAKAMSDDDLQAVIAIIEEEHGIPETTPRLLVRHAKGDRADHFHVVYSLVDPVTGRAIRTQRKQFQDELASRRAELLLCEDIVAGVNQSAVIAELATRPRFVGQAANLGVTAPDRFAHISPTARQQANRCDADAPAILTKTFRAFKAADGDRQELLLALAEHGIFVGAGRKAAMLVDQQTGFTHSLVRAIRIGAKVDGDSVTIKERDLARMLGQLEPVDVIEERCRKSAALLGMRKVEQQAGMLQREAVIDRDDDAMKWLVERRLLSQAQQNQELEATQKARRQHIRANLKDAEEIGNKRIDRAFLASKITETTAFRQIAILAVTAGVTLAGGGLGLALITAGVALGALPNKECERALKLDEKLTMRRERTKDDTDLAVALGRFRRTARGILPRPGRTPDIPQRIRPVAAGFVRAQFLPVDQVEQYLDRAQDNFLRFLGRKLMDFLLNEIFFGNGRTALVANRGGKRKIYVRELDRLRSQQERSAASKIPAQKSEIKIGPPRMISPLVPLQRGIVPAVAKFDSQKAAIRDKPVAQQKRQIPGPEPQTPRIITLDPPRRTRLGKMLGKSPRTRGRDRGPER